MGGAAKRSAGVALRALACAVLVLGLAAGAGAQGIPAVVTVGNANALAGTDVAVPVTFDPGGQSAIFVRIDIETNLLTQARRVSPAGPLDCTANPQIGFTTATFSCLVGTSTTCSRVRAILARQGGPPLRIDWKVRRNGDGWRIADIVVEGVSMALTYRQEYTAFIQKHDGKLQALIDTMKAKAREN